MAPQPLALALLVTWIVTRGLDLLGTSEPAQDRHWAFQPLADPQPPAVADAAWPRGDLDRFILARLEQAGLHPAPEADRLTWLRRVSLDLTGLPPTPEAVDAFLADATPQAHERVVDRLLASPRYGERWAQHWLDVVRFADTHGFEVNTERPNAWPYRDYVIRAFNQDLPYHRFIREQIVGDALDEDAATGFLVTASVLLPGQIGADEPSKRLARQDALDEIVVNITQTFLGLSVGCARCHDHKTDPISQREYYAMQAFVAGVEYEDRDLHTPEAETLRARERQIRQRLAEIEAELPQLDAEELDRAARLEEDRRQTQAELVTVAHGQKAFAGSFRNPDLIRVLRRGDPEQPRDEVTPAIPSALGSLNLPADTPEQARRRALADWIAAPDNPLTARVLVNRIWQGHFGTGLVETPSDFGRAGARPSHPELLDWLAFGFTRSEGSIKRLHRLIVLSATYRQSNAIDPLAREKDADTRLLWRYPSRRLEAESLRDTLLAVSGRLNLTMYGRGFDLFDKRGGLTGFQPIESPPPDGLRRMIYAHKVRRERDAVFGAFDCPDAGQSTDRRRESTTPIQALNLFNSPFTFEAAQALAERAATETEPTLPRQIHRAYRLTLGRGPTHQELRESLPVVQNHGLIALARALLNCNESLFLP